MSCFGWFRKKQNTLRFRSALNTNFIYTPNVDSEDKDYPTASWIFNNFERLEEEIKILKSINNIDYVCIDPKDRGYNFKDEYLNLDKSRIKLKELGYTFIGSYKHKGEVWIKKEIKK